MSDYIGREAIKNAMLRYGFKAPDMTVTEFVEDELPAADVEPERNGRWEECDWVDVDEHGFGTTEPLRQDCGATSALVFSKRSCFGNETIAPIAAAKWIWRTKTMTIERAIEMPRLIDAEELELQFDVSDEDIIAKEIIRNAPTVDAVPVVRCRDCKHLHMWDQKDIYAFCPKTNIVFLPFEKDTRTFFCSFGEAKMNGGIENASKEM